MINEELYPMGWRFNSGDCSLSDKDKEKIIFLDTIQSKKLWDSYFPFVSLHYMTEYPNFFKQVIKKEVQFFEDKPFIYQDCFTKNELIIFFWGSHHVSIVPSHIFLKGWDDFFYPSDENCILIIPSKLKAIFSFNEIMYMADIYRA